MFFYYFTIAMYIFLAHYFYVNYSNDSLNQKNGNNKELLTNS